MTDFANVVAFKTMNLLAERKALLYEDGTAFYLWKRGDRLVIIFDTDEINLKRVDAEFAHLLSTRLNGRRVVRTNSRGVFLQVGREIPPAPMDLVAIPLDLGGQPTPTSIPIGMTGRGPFWLDLIRADSILLGGSRDMGKTTMIHGWIQSLLNGGSVQVRAWDGKDGSEFGRYADRPNFMTLGDLEHALRDLLLEANKRRALLKNSGFANAKEYSVNVDTMNPIALVIDEAALVPERSKILLKEIVERCRDTGIHPIFGTNNPQQSALVVKSNLVTRISLAVPHLSASVMVLGHSGAETLRRTPGRGLIEWGGSMVEFQAFRVERPMPSDDAKKALAAIEPTEPTPLDETTRLAESIRSQWDSSMSKRKTAELLGKTYAGAWAAKIDKIVAILGATTTPTPVFMADLSQLQAVAE